MSERLESYLEEIGHFLSGRGEREEILSEIRSAILEKAEREHGGVTDASLTAVIAAYGPARRVAARYVESPIIAPVYRRFLFRYTALLFGAHAALTIAAVIFHESFIMFPILYVPRMNPFEAVLYLPTAFLFDLGAVTLILYLITQSGKEVKLPWPKFSVDLDEIGRPKPRFWNIAGAAVSVILTGLAIYVFAACRTVFVLSLDFSHPRPLFSPAFGYRLSLLFIGMLVTGTGAAIIRIFTGSRWVSASSNALTLVFIGLIFRLHSVEPFAIESLNRMAGHIRIWARLSLLLIALMVAIELVKDLVAIGRGFLRRVRS